MIQGKRISNFIAYLTAVVFVGGIAVAQNGSAASDASGVDPESGVGIEDQVLGEVRASFYSELPSMDGELLAEATLDQLAESEGQVDDASYAVLHVEGRAYAFRTDPVGMTAGDYLLAVEGAVTEQLDEAQSSAGVGIEDVAMTLWAGVHGHEDVLILARPESGVNVVTFIASQAEVTGATVIDATDEHVAVVLDNGWSTILDVATVGENLGELEVDAGEGPHNILDGIFWQRSGDDGVTTPGDAGGDGAADAQAAGDAAEEADTDDMDVGIGLDIDQDD